MFSQEMGNCRPPASESLVLQVLRNGLVPALGQQHQHQLNKPGREKRKEFWPGGARLSSATPDDMPAVMVTTSSARWDVAVGRLGQKW